MAEHEALDAVGVPKTAHLFAAFDSEETAREAARQLTRHWEEPEVLTSAADTAALAGEQRESHGWLETIQRGVKGFGGEKNVAERYAARLKEGAVVIAVPVPDRDAAKEAADLVADMGAYDIAYFGPWTYEFFHSETTARKAVPDQTQGDTTC